MEDYTEKITVEVEGEQQTQTKKYSKNTGERGLILIRPPTIEKNEEITIEISGSREGAAAGEQQVVKKIMDED